MDEVVSRKMGGVGQPRFLSEEQESKLVEEVGSGRFKTAGEIADWVELEYGEEVQGEQHIRFVAAAGVFTEGSKTQT